MNIKVIYGKMLVTMSHVFGVDFAKKFDTRVAIPQDSQFKESDFFGRQSHLR